MAQSLLVLDLSSMDDHTQRGVTLVELVLYVALIGVVLGSVSVFLCILLSARVNQQVIAEVEG